MIIVKYQKLVEKTFGLVELELFFQGHQVMLKVPSTLPQPIIDYLKERGKKIISLYMANQSKENP